MSERALHLRLENAVREWLFPDGERERGRSGAERSFEALEQLERMRAEAVAVCAELDREREARVFG